MENGATPLPPQRREEGSLSRLNFWAGRGRGKKKKTNPRLPGFQKGLFSFLSSPAKKIHLENQQTETTPAKKKKKEKRE
jgi:hypothetical protein